MSQFVLNRFPFRIPRECSGVKNVALKQDGFTLPRIDGQGPAPDERHRPVTAGHHSEQVPLVFITNESVYRMSGLKYVRAASHIAMKG